MKFNFFLNGATAMALLGGFGLATPALAQGVNGPQYSTPAEQAETQRLNEQGINGTTESPAVLNGEATDTAAPQASPYYNNGYNDQSYSGDTNPAYPQAPNNGAPMPGTYGGDYGPPTPSYQQQQYNAQMQDYQNQSDQYQYQRDRYNRAMDRYRYDRDRYDWDPWYWGPYP
jgi:hypothetical protein